MTKKSYNSSFFILSFLAILLSACESYSPIKFSTKSKLFKETYTLKVAPRKENHVIRYTTDGSIPNEKSKIWNDSIVLFNDSFPDYIYSQIPTTALEGPAQLKFFKWRAPKEATEKMHILNFQTFEGEEKVGDMQHRSIFICDSFDYRFNLPVISLVLDPEDLFDYKKGIYVPGIHFDSSKWNRWWPPGNYNQKWKKKARFTYFNNSGRVLVNTEAEVKVIGFGVAGFPQKSFRIDFLKNGESTTVSRRIIPDLDYRPSSVNLRNSGQDFNSTLFRDVFNHSIAENLNFITQRSQPCVVFLNGEYWGIQNLRERIDDSFFKNKYEIGKSEYDLIEDCGIVETGNDKKYNKLIELLKSDAEFLDIAEEIDLESFVDYTIFELYIANYDWPSVNRRMFREEQSMWEFILNDTDYSLGYDKAGITTKKAYWNAFENATVKGVNKWPHHDCSTLLFRKMFSYPEFRKLFETRYYELAASVLHPEYQLEQLDDLQKIYEREMTFHINRWQYPKNKDKWYGEIQKMRTFIKERPWHFKNHMQEYFATFDQ